MLTYEKILAELNEKRRMQFRSDPERDEVMRAATTLALVSVLEKLADDENVALAKEPPRY